MELAHCRCCNILFFKALHSGFKVAYMRFKLSSESFDSYFYLKFAPLFITLTK